MTNVTKIDLFLLDHPNIDIHWCMDPLNVIHIKMAKGNLFCHKCVTREEFKDMVESGEDIFYEILFRMAETLEKGGYAV